MKDGDMISCAPKSVRLLQHWELLDTNGDGVWSRTKIFQNMPKCIKYSKRYNHISNPAARRPPALRPHKRPPAGLLRMGDRPKKARGAAANHDEIPDHVRVFIRALRREQTMSES